LMVEEVFLFFFPYKMHFLSFRMSNHKTVSSLSLSRLPISPPPFFGFEKGENCLSPSHLMYSCKKYCRRRLISLRVKSLSPFPGIEGCLGTRLSPRFLPSRGLRDGVKGIPRSLPPACLSFLSGNLLKAVSLTLGRSKRGVCRPRILSHPPSDKNEA